MDKVIYCLKEFVYYVQVDSKIYLYTDEDLYLLDMEIQKHLIIKKIIDILIQKPRKKEDIQKLINLTSDDINYYLEILKNFIYRKNYKFKVVLMGDTKILTSVQGKINANEIYLEIYKSYELIRRDIGELEGTDLVIISQNLLISPVYEYINNKCFSRNIPVLNIFYNFKKLIIGPFITKDSGVCYKCFSKRWRANQINSKTNNLKEELRYNSLNYDDKNYKYLIDWKFANRAAEEILYFLNGINKKYSEHLDIIKVFIIGENSSYVYNLYSVPFCPICSQEDKINYYSEKAEMERSQTCELDLSFINKEVGIFRKFINAKTILSGVEIYYYTIQVPCIYDIINKFSDEDKFHYNIAGGVSIKKEKAIGKAVGEACERYCIEAYLAESLEKHTIKFLIQEQINYVDNLKLFSDWQYEQEGFIYHKPNRDEPILWTSGKDLTNMENVLLPASFIYTRYNNVGDAFCIGKLSTSGAACSTSFKDAVYYGILELIERDCTIITWLQKLSVPRVDFDFNNYENDEIKGLYNLLQENNINVSIYYITLDLEIPCFLALGSSSCKELPATLIGAGCRVNKEHALIRALEEIVQGCGWSKLQNNIKNFEPGENYKNVNGFMERVCLYAKKTMKKEFDFLLNTSNCIKFDDISYNNLDNEKSYNMCFEILRKNHMQLIAKDLTTYDVKSLGLVVVKVYIPQLQQIEADYNYRFLNNPRIYEVPRKLGYTNIGDDSRYYNKAPHPFP